MTRMTKFRWHREMYTDSMSTVTEAHSWADLRRIIFAHWEPGVLTVKKYGNPGGDPRNGWDTHIVCVNGEAVGFSDGMPV